MAWEVFTGNLGSGTVEGYPFNLPSDIDTAYQGYTFGSVGGQPSGTATYPFKQEPMYNNYFNFALDATWSMHGTQYGISLYPTQWGGNANINYTSSSMGFFIDNERQFGRVFTYARSPYGSYYAYASENTDAVKRQVYEFLTGHTVPEFTLRSLDKVVGTDATLWLSSIKDEYTNGGEPVVDVSIDYMRSRDPRSLINDLAIGTSPKLLCTTNDTENEKTELLLSWSGSDYTLIGKTTNKISGQTTTQVSVPLGTIGVNDYLGILVDDEQEVATITVIEITPSSLRIAYNYAETKSFLQTPTLAHIFYTMLMGAQTPEDEDEDDPYPDNKPNKHGGGSGDRDYTSDDNPNTPLPNAIACDLGFITLFSPTESQLRQLASYMWTDDLFDLDNFKKLFADPMDCILNLSKYPVTVTTQSAKPVVVGNVSTHINMFTVANEFVDVGKGYAKIAQQLNAFLDYSPHTQLEVYLPFCGRHHLNVDLYVQRKFIALSYRINVLTGGCVATLSDKQTGDVLDQFSGNCAYSIPFTSTNYQNAINSLVQAGAGLASGYVGGIMGINPKATITSHVGNVGSAGAVSSLQPYFIFTCPTLVTPADANKIQGQPAYTTHTISELTGFVKVRSIDLASASATVDELNEIETILKGGAYI